MADVIDLYSMTEKRLLPVRDRIMEAIYNTPEELSLAEIIGLLEIIKVELIEEFGRG